MKAQLNSETITLRHDLTLELFIDELLSIAGATEIEFVDGPGGTAPTIEGSSGIRLYEVGRYHFRVTDADGTRSDLKLICFELPLLAHIERQCRLRNSGGEEVNDRRVRRVARALAQTSWWDGTLASVTTGDPTRSLSHLGA
jgi:hypothetical protein